MDLRDYLILGSYGYTTAVFLFVCKLLKNHVETRLSRLEHRLGLDKEEDQ